MHDEPDKGCFEVVGTETYSFTEVFLSSLAFKVLRKDCLDEVEAGKGTLDVFESLLIAEGLTVERK